MRAKLNHKLSILAINMIHFHHHTLYPKTSKSAFIWPMYHTNIYTSHNWCDPQYNMDRTLNVARNVFVKISEWVCEWQMFEVQFSWMIFVTQKTRASYGCVYCDDLAENWLRYNGTALYLPSHAYFTSKYFEVWAQGSGKSPLLVILHDFHPLQSVNKLV